MQESIIFHIIFGVFFLFFLIWSYNLAAKYQGLKKNLLPLLLKKNFSFPEDRSLVVRSLNSLEQELGSQFQCRVTIFLPSTSLKGTHTNFLRVLCCLATETPDKECFVVYKNQNYLLENILSLIKSYKKIEHIKFSFSQSDYTSIIEIIGKS